MLNRAILRQKLQAAAESLKTALEEAKLEESAFKDAISHMMNQLMDNASTSGEKYAAINRCEAKCLDANIPEKLKSAILTTCATYYLLELNSQYDDNDPNDKPKIQNLYNILKDAVIPQPKLQEAKGEEKEPNNNINMDPNNSAYKVLQATARMLHFCNVEKGHQFSEQEKQDAINAVNECESICLTTPISNKLQRAALAVCAAAAAFFVGFAIGAAAGAWTGPAAIFTGLVAGIYAAIGVVAGSVLVGGGTHAALRHTSLFKMPYEDEVKQVIEQQRIALGM